MLTAQHWLDRAEEARTIAAGMRTADAKRQMEEIARGYEHMARIAAKRDADSELSKKPDKDG